DEWRRSNTDSIIVALNKAIKETKPWVKFGISPFGVWRNKSQDPMGSPTQGGVTNYDDLYADILLWTRNGWIDYVIPQLYWEMGHPKVAFETLIDWWSQHTYGRHMYIGHGIYRALEKNSKAWHDPNQLPRQLQVLRQTPNIHGSAYFSSRSFNTNPNGWNDSLQNNYYRTPVQVPPMEWLPAKPGATDAAVSTN
ncbi:MAG TPA: family 10 glycosylhydrolase, partial [Flavisolibacter sp.]|nr:family 10 glycosylhydrolase [Flavisolibacter sp.]